MRTITCNACGEVIKPDENRFCGSIQEANNEKRDVIRFIIIEHQDFCSPKCIVEYMELQLKKYGEMK